MNSNLIIKLNNDSVLLFLEWMGICLSINKRAFTIGMNKIKNDTKCKKVDANTQLSSHAREK